MMVDERNGQGISAAADDSEPSIEEAFAQIRDLLAEMEDENVPLEKSFENYEKGMKLIRRCNERIDAVEKKVQQMNADGSCEDLPDRSPV